MVAYIYIGIYIYMPLFPLLYCGLFLRPKLFTVDSSVYSTGPDSKQNTQNDERKARMQAGRKGGREGEKEGRRKKLIGPLKGRV